MIHLKTVHEGGIKPTYNCSLCDYKSQEKSETLKHVKEVHKELCLKSIFSEKNRIPSEFTTSNEGVLLRNKKRHIESVHEEENEAVHEKKKLKVS